MSVIDEQTLAKMDRAAPLLGEPACTELRKCIDEIRRLRGAVAEASEHAKTYRLALALALSIPVGRLNIDSAAAWIDDWKARNGGA
jgi:hypothetical protein